MHANTTQTHKPTPLRFDTRISNAQRVFTFTHRIETPICTSGAYFYVRGNYKSDNSGEAMYRHYRRADPRGTIVRGGAGRSVLPEKHLQHMRMRVTEDTCVACHVFDGRHAKVRS